MDRLIEMFFAPYERVMLDVQCLCDSWASSMHFRQKCLAGENVLQYFYVSQ